jgi:GT2 family glycosyltransferase
MISVVMLAYGEEEWLTDAADAVLASEGVDIELVLVDNGTTTDAVDRAVEEHPEIVLVRPGRNLGFTGGVNLGVSRCGGDRVALVNSDAVVERDCLCHLARELDDEAAGIVGGLILLADGERRGRINSAGNPVHVLGLCWSGRLGSAPDGVPAVSEHASVSGACLMLRREVWDELGGFSEQYFAYMEDMELCWRAWQRGYAVRLVGTAQCHHHYEFSRSPLKMYLVERNRLLFVMTNYQARTLALLGIPLIGFDAAMLLVATAQGWGRQKLQGWGWILGHPGWIRARRSLVQRSRTVRDRELARLLTDTFDSEQMALPRAAEPLQRLLRGWWRAVRPVL